MNTSELIIVVGATTAIVSILTKIVGLPDKIKKNYTRKSTKGVSTILITLLCPQYILWTFYGFLKEDLFLMIGHGVGVVTTGIIMFQILKYKTSN